jgi:hypothetical protein
MTRFSRPLVAVLLAAGLLAAVPGASVGKVPADHLRPMWQHACAKAGGLLSDQPALVCDHLGEPQWDLRTVGKLVRFCEHALGGRAEVRSQYPQELVACVF